jgi:uncharacterized membrane protein
MDQNSVIKIKNASVKTQSATEFYGFAWKRLWKYFLELLLVTIVSIVVLLPTIGRDDNGYKFFANNSISIDFFFISFQGAGAYVVFVIAYMLLLQSPIEYGISYINLLAARDKKFQVTDLFHVFQNYWNAVFANLLTMCIIGFGIILLIIPGVIFACKLAFVPYLVVDKKMDAVEAIKKSWEMTTGQTATIFLMGVMAFFIGILGLIVVGVGIIISIMWIHLAFAAIYLYVSNQIPDLQSETVPNKISD